MVTPMPHKQSWLIKNHVVSVYFSGIVSAEEVGEAFHLSEEHVLESSDPPVHFLHNWQDVSQFPRSISAVYKATENSKVPIRHIGWVVAYGKSTRLYRFMGDIFFQLFNVRFRLFETLEEAINFLVQNDNRLEKADIMAELNQR